MKIECPNHNGSFDCTPFCEICGGEQEVDGQQITACTCDDYEMFCCLDCAACTLCNGEYYMVHDEIWYSAITAMDRTGMLCIGCLEARLGKLLTARDFTDAPINTIWGSNGSARLASRMQEVPQIT